MGFLNRIQHAWNAFLSRDPTQSYWNYGTGSSYRPDRPRFSRGNEKSIVTAVYNRIALDVATIDIKHIRVDKDGRYEETIDSTLNN